MRWGPVASILGLILSAHVPLDPDEPARLFRNIDVAPYQINQPLEISFSYLTSLVESTTIRVYLSNEVYSEVLVYARVLDVNYSFTSSFNIIASLLKFDQATLQFRASGVNFIVTQTLKIYQRNQYLVEMSDVDSHLISTAKHSRIDGYGNTHYLAETVNLLGFVPVIERPYYLEFDISMLTFTASSEAGTPVTFSSISLLIADHSYALKLLPRNINLDFVQLRLFAKNINGQYRFDFADTLFVDPITFTPSSFLIPGFVATNRLFLPKDRYLTLKTIQLRLVFTISIGHSYQIVYQPAYYFATALLGSCIDSLYCVLTTNRSIDAGSWKDIAVHG